VCAHDTASAFAAAPVQRAEDSLIISSGTWSLIGKLINEPITTAEAMSANFSNEGGLDAIRFLKNCMGMWIPQELLRLWRERDGRNMGWEEVTRLLKEAKPFTAFIDPDARCFYNPADMERSIVEFCKKTRQPPPGDRGTCLRVVFESLAFKYRVVNEEIERILKAANRNVHIVGGGCRNELLNQFTASALGLPVFAGPEEATGLGNVLVQALALGALGDRTEMNRAINDTCSIRRYLPQDTRRWDGMYERFLGYLEKRTEPTGINIRGIKQHYRYT
jgi:rhamnulokinase